MEFKGKNLNKLHNTIGDLLNKKDDIPSIGFILASISQLAGLENISVELDSEQTLLPINSYVMCLADSGYGKNRTLGFLQKRILNTFLSDYKAGFETKLEASIYNYACDYSNRSNMDLDSAEKEIAIEVKSLGKPVFQFSSATVPAVRQLYQLYSVANSGSLNLIIDEIGANLVENKELLEWFLEAFDIGEVDQKVLKNSHESARIVVDKKCVPANILMFGTPRLLLYGKDRWLLNRLLDQGYARRTLFFSQKENIRITDEPEEIKELRKKALSNSLELSKLFQVNESSKVIHISDEVEDKVIEYIDGLSNAPKYGTTGLEQTGRAGKFIKLLGLLAYIERKNKVDMDNFYDAIDIINISSECLSHIVDGNSLYQEFIKYIKFNGNSATKVSSLAYFPDISNPVWNKIHLPLCQAYALTNGCILSASTDKAIETYYITEIASTDLDNLGLSASSHMAKFFIPKNITFEQFKLLGKTEAPYGFCNHKFENDERSNENLIPGFDFIVLDVDNGTPITEIEDTFSDFCYYLYTTKRHTKEHNRCRVLLPIEKALKLSEPDYKQTLRNFVNILPFSVDEASCKPAQKWACHKSEYTKFNETQNKINITEFLPSLVSKRKVFEGKDFKFSDAMTDWAIYNATIGSRNNTLYRYAKYLHDCELPKTEIKEKLIRVNALLPESLPSQEVIAIIDGIYNRKD